MRENKVEKLQQQGIEDPNPDSVNPDKLLIPYKYKNSTELKNLKREKYFTKAIL